MKAAENLKTQLRHESNDDNGGVLEPLSGFAAAVCAA